MAIHFQRPVLSTHPIRCRLATRSWHLTRRWLSNSYSHSKRAGEFAALLLLIGSTNASMADSTADSAVTLRPYIAQYMTTTRGMDLALTRQLKQGADGSYTLTNGGKIMVVGFHEVSVFDVEGDRIVPRSYVYQGTGLINRRREVHFTPGSPIVRSLYKEQWYDLPRSQKTLDRMSQQEQLRLRLLNDPTPRGDIAVQIADGKRVKDYTLVFVGEELVQTPLGAVKSLHFTRIHDDPERKSDIWLAPDWDYLMVKTLHVEDESPVEITLTSATIEGQPVAPL